jgi:hypothetical protein
MLHISTVFVSKPEHISYAEAMSRLRMWLDFRKIETSSFKLAPEGQEGFEITFGTNSHGGAWETVRCRTMPSNARLRNAFGLTMITAAQGRANNYQPKPKQTNSCASTC